MDCRETQALLTAFHDGELPAADRARVEAHLRGCPECRTRQADLARADQAAGVPDPGPAYWDRFNARVMDRIARDAGDPGVTVLRPKGGWMRQQLRYLLPAAAAAALVVMVVHYGGMNSVAPTPTVPPAVREPAVADSAGKTAERAAAARRPPPPPSVAGERSTAVTREERDRPADRTGPAGNVEASRDRAAAPAAIGAPSPPPMTLQGAPAGSPPVTAAVPRAEQEVSGKTKSASGMWIAKETSPDGQERPRAGAGGDATGSVAPAASPCELARMLAAQERWRNAEAAQRACLAGDLDAPSREKGLVFLAELLDRQTRFADADAVIAEVDRQFPQSRTLDLYRQQRPMVQKHPMAVPVTR